MRSSPNTQLDQESDDFNEFTDFPILPGTYSDTMQHIMYFLLLRILRDKSRHDIGYLRLISRVWEQYITYPREHLNLNQAPTNLANLEALRLTTLQSVGLSPLPALQRPLFAVFFTFMNYHTNKHERISDRGLLNPKIRCFEVEREAHQYAAANAGAMFEYSGQNLEVRKFKFIPARKLPSCGVLKEGTAHATLFYKARVEELRSLSASPQVEEPSGEAAEPDAKMRSRKNSGMSGD